MDPSSGTSLVIDIDSLVVPGIFPPKVIGTRGYAAPEVVATSQLPLDHPEKRMPNIKTDLHALAVIFYETLLLRHPLEGKKSYSDDPETDDLLAFGEKALFIENSSDTSNRPDHLKVSFRSLGPNLFPLFQRAFIDGLQDPEERPTAHEWEEAFTFTLDLLYPCRGKQCKQKWFVYEKGSKPRCPFCGWEITGGFPPIMHLFRWYRTGQYFSEQRYVAMWNKKKLYAWHMRSDVSPPLDLSSAIESEASITLQNHTWFFRNESRKKMICSSSENVIPGNSIRISNGRMLLLSEAPEGRLALFETLN